MLVVLEMAGPRAPWCRAPPSHALSSLSRPNKPARILRRATFGQLTDRFEPDSFFFRIARFSRTYATSLGQPKDGQLLDPEEWSLLRRLLSNPSEKAMTSSAGPPSDRFISQPSVNLKHQVTRDVSGLTKSLKDPTTRFAYLGQLAEAAQRAQEQLGTMSTAALAQLPTTVFSELLRSLDPLDSFSKELDPTDGMHVGPGMAQYTPLGEEFDTWGIRKRYVVLLDRALSAARLRIQAGRALQLPDYKMLLRCAGAAGNLDAMSVAWDLMEETDLRELDPEVYAELIKARFFTEPLYAQYDINRLRVRPINLHMQKIWIMGRVQRHYLRILGYNLARRRRHNFGYNPLSQDRAEHLTRLLRRHRPVYSLMKVATRPCYIVDERTLCAFMAALARSGSLRVMEVQILEKYWGIKVTRRAGSEAHVEIQAVMYNPDSPLRPTERLLEAIVHGYCTNAEFPVALAVLDAVSSCYAIPISEKVWFSLFEWASVLSSKPVRTEWKVMNRQFRGTKRISRSAVQMVWDTMTAEPYNVRPGFHQYKILAKDLIGYHSVTRALDVLLVMEPMYKDLLTELESAFSKHALSTALGVNVAASRRAWERARAQKYAALHALQGLCGKLLKRVDPRSVKSYITLRRVPQFVEAFREVLPPNITYPIATGKVQIHRLPGVTRFEQHMVQFTQLPLTTSDVKIHHVTKPRVKVIEEKQLRPAPHVSLQGFLDDNYLSWSEVQREFF